MQIPWIKVRSLYEKAAEYDNDDRRTHRISLKFGSLMWQKVREVTTDSDNDPNGVDAKLWLLTVALLWHALVQDWGAYHPMEFGAWEYMVGNLGLDIHHHFGIPADRDDDSLQQAVWRDAEIRIAELRSSERFDGILGSSELDLPLSFVHSVGNIEHGALECLKKERSRLATVQPFVQSASELILQRLSRRPQDLFRISPREFEQVVAELLADAGYTVELTPPTRDGGYDIIARNNGPDGEKCILVETKRYRRDRKVGVELVRSLFGTLTDREADRAILVSSSGFTSGARSFQARHPYELDLKDYGSLAAWLRAYGDPKRG
jgi:hypothetical protein